MRSANYILLAGLTGLLLCALTTTALAAAVKDIAQIDGARDNQLIGFGLIGGLAGTGDDPKNSPYTADAIANMLAGQGFHVEARSLNVKNFAAVMVTCDLGPFLRDGDRIDVTVSSIGSAKSLSGGVLYQTLLKGADGNVYAVAQGEVSLGRSIGGGGGGGRAKEHTTTGRVPQGATVEAEVPSTVLKPDGTIRLNLREPDYSSASRLAAAINDSLGEPLATALDAGSVAVRVPLAQRTELPGFIGAIEELSVTPGTRAKVVINQRTGTIVIGSTVTINPVSVTHNSLTFTFGSTLDTPLAQLAPADDDRDQTAEAGSGAGDLAGPTTAEEVSRGLARLQLRSEEIVAVFEAIAAAGALNGQLEII